MEFTKPYKDINDTLYWLIEQSKDNMDYANQMEKFDYPGQMFDRFKMWTKFKNDPSDRELIQGVETLFENNFHGWSGLGDCDCFVCSLISMCWANGWNNIYIVLAGRNKQKPSHIYMLIDHGGQQYVMDATEPYFDSEREYPYKQILPLF